MKKKLGWILSLTLCFALMIAETLVTASASASVSYIDDKGNPQTRDSATVVTESDTTWGAGWYVVNDDVTIDQHVTVTGDVHLILKDGYTLTASQGINVTDTNSLTIYGQAEGTGKLTATGDGAGIGGIYIYAADPANFTSGTITINGGIVTANGSGGAGIGGGAGGAGGEITINGGTVTATGGTGCAGIGGGRDGAGGTITINGGHVIANGSQGTQQYFCAGIGGGFQRAGGSITINGGVVEAHGGWTGIGSGENGSSGTATGECAVTVTGGVVTATGDNSAGIGGTFSTGEDGNAVIIADSISDNGNTTSWSGVIFQDTSGQVYGSNVTPTENFEIPEGYILTIGNGETLTIPADVTLTNNGTITVDGGTLTNNGTIVNRGRG